MSIAKILWVDDEIESLQSQKLFLEQKGYEVTTKTNGFDALEYVKSNYVDVVLMDESMPGISGLETLARIKAINRQLPIVLITKNETENLMNEAIGSQISDYLIKPVNPNQVWLSLKKLIDNNRLVAEKTTTSYQQNFRELFMALNDNPDHQQWMDIYKRLVHWELEMEKSDMKLHYARLELNNANVKCDSLRDKIKKLDMDLLKEKTGRHNEFMTTIVMKILFILLVLFDFYRVIMW